MAASVMIQQVVNQVRVFDGASGVAPETVQALAEAILPLVSEMLEHGERVRNEGSLHNGYLDRIEKGSR
jgi:hypothetical protein